jgi:hypothetical protein
MSDDWKRRAWTCDECGLTVEAHTKGDGANGIRLAHDPDGHRLVFPPNPDPYWLDQIPAGVNVQVLDDGKTSGMTEMRFGV